MKPLRTLLGFVFLGLAGFILVGLSLPSDWEAEATVTIAAPPDRVYAQIGTLRAWEHWAVWFEHDPDMEAHYEGPPTGADAVFRWSGDNTVGQGAFRVTSATPDQRVELALSMQDGRFTAEGPIRLSPADDGTRVVWTFRGDFGKDPFGRFNRRFLEQAVTATLQDSLHRLKTYLESPAPDPDLGSESQASDE